MNITKIDQWISHASFVSPLKLCAQWISMTSKDQEIGWFGGVLAILGTCQIYLNVQDDPGWIWTPPLIIGGGQVSGILLGTETKSLFRDNPSIFHRPRVMNPSWPYAWDIISAVSLKWGTPKSSKFMFTGGFSMGKPRSFWYLQV